MTVNNVSNTNSSGLTSPNPSQGEAPAVANDPVSQLVRTAQVGSPLEQGGALRQLDQITGDRSASEAIARGETPRPTSANTTAPEVCTVEVRFKPVALGANHAFIVTTDNNSVNYFRGGPQANNTGLNSSSNTSGSNDNGARPYDGNYGVYGPIVTEYGAYRENTVDWTTSPSGTQVVDRIAGNCDRIEREFARHMDDIEAARINYMPLHQNSNSTVRETLERAGYPDVSPVSWAPAWNTQLPQAGR